MAASSGGTVSGQNFEVSTQLEHGGGLNFSCITIRSEQVPKDHNKLGFVRVYRLVSLHALQEGRSPSHLCSRDGSE